MQPARPPRAAVPSKKAASELPFSTRRCSCILRPRPGSLLFLSAAISVRPPFSFLLSGHPPSGNSPDAICTPRLYAHCTRSPAALRQLVLAHTICSLHRRCPEQPGAPPALAPEGTAASHALDSAKLPKPSPSPRRARAEPSCASGARPPLSAASAPRPTTTSTAARCAARARRRPLSSPPQFFAARHLPPRCHLSTARRHTRLSIRFPRQSSLARPLVCEHASDSDTAQNICHCVRGTPRGG